MNQKEFISQLKFNEQGLIPAIVQDADTKDVLMMAYMDNKSLQMSFECGETVFWSRSRKTYWHKDETSGNTQRILSITPDCDFDTLLVIVTPKGPACHTGATTCFFAPAQKTEFNSGE
jgi:phosphoribosyl-AMP cyclohydrolase / phosphoribosyl-ATP pyrophosphohydrolase